MSNAKPSTPIAQYNTGIDQPVKPIEMSHTVTFATVAILIHQSVSSTLDRKNNGAFRVCT